MRELHNWYAVFVVTFVLRMLNSLVASRTRCGGVAIAYLFLTKSELIRQVWLCCLPVLRVLLLRSLGQSQEKVDQYQRLN